MFTEFTHQPESGWNTLYRIAGVGTLIALGLMLLDIALSFGGGDAAVGVMTAEEWFAALQANWFVGLRNLGLFNMINTALSLPLYLALYHMHRKAAPAMAALALIVFIVGAAIYETNNRALAMLDLSHRYAAAGSEAQRGLIAAAGTALLAQGEDFTPGTFAGFFLTCAASLMMMAVMLRCGVFGRLFSLVGMVGTGLLLVFTISVTFAPETMSAAMTIALVGGLLMLGWNFGMALRLFRMGSSDRRAVNLSAQG